MNKSLLETFEDEASINTEDIGAVSGSESHDEIYSNVGFNGDTPFIIELLEITGTPEASVLQEDSFGIKPIVVVKKSTYSEKQRLAVAKYRKLHPEQTKIQAKRTYEALKKNPERLKRFNKQMEEVQKRIREKKKAQGILNEKAGRPRIPDELKVKKPKLTPEQRAEFEAKRAKAKEDKLKLKEEAKLKRVAKYGDNEYAQMKLRELKDTHPEIYKQRTYKYVKKVKPPKTEEPNPNKKVRRTKEEMIIYRETQKIEKEKKKAEKEAKKATKKQTKAEGESKVMDD